MGKALQLIRGMPRMAEVSGISSVYDQTLLMAADYAANTQFTLPLARTYSSVELEVFRNGQFLESVIDYTYVGSIPRTQITLLSEIITGERLRFRIPMGADALTIYDEIVVVGGGGITAGTSITLPSAKTYQDAELAVYLDGQFLEPTIDYTYVGLAPRTQIQMTFDLLSGERLRLRIVP